MKFRDGFVSNSSSSSFIITGPRRPTVAELEFLFGVIPDSVCAKFMEPFIRFLVSAPDLEPDDWEWDECKELRDKGVWVGRLTVESDADTIISQLLYSQPGLVDFGDGPWKIERGW